MIDNRIRSIINRTTFGKRLWYNTSVYYHKIRKGIKRKIQKNKDFKRYVYPVIGKHPTSNDVFLVLTPTYRNLGDHAIAKAERELLIECGIKYCEVSIDVIKILAKNNDYEVFGCSTILITGGGYLGTLWPHMHEMTSKIIENNPKAKIVILPNTLFFDQTLEGKQLFEKSLLTFNKPNIKRIYFREKMSFEMVRDKYLAVKMMPDVVLSLNESQPGIKRHGCLICLRNDKEKTLSESQTVAVFDSAKQLFKNDVIETDMQNAIDVSLDERMQTLDQKFDQFRHAQLVITDRLHGMIFSAITGTACIVVNSRSHKLLGCYEWIKHLDYIRFCNNTEDICRIYSEIPQEEHYYDLNRLTPWFEELKTELVSIIKE